MFEFSISFTLRLVAWIACGCALVLWLRSLPKPDASEGAPDEGEAVEGETHERLSKARLDSRPLQAMRTCFCGPLAGCTSSAIL